MKKLYLIIGCMMTACTNNPPSLSKLSSSNYVISIEAENPNTAYVELRLQESRDPNLKLISRAENLGLTSQIYEVSCKGETIQPSEDSSWSIPSECSNVNWKVTFDEAADLSIQPSNQRSIYMTTGWWVFSAPTSLLRIESNSDEAVTIEISVSGHRVKTETLYGLNEPPNFFVLGKAPSKAVSLDNSSLTYYGENLQDVISVIIPEKHLESIAYFKSVIGSENSRDVDELSVVWFGAPRERSEVSGAAGYDKILANYIIPEDAPKREEQLLSLMLVLHEQFHQLDRGSHPTWIGESLANYYALKGLVRAYPNDESVSQIWKRFIDTSRPVTIGLVDIQNQISNDQNRENYGLFYSQGATFWAELDAVIKESSAGRESLDDIIPSIMEIETSSESNHIVEIQRLLSPIPKRKFDRLKTKYLG